MILSSASNFSNIPSTHTASRAREGGITAPATYRFVPGGDASGSSTVMLKKNPAVPVSGALVQDASSSGARTNTGSFVAM
jgi:hypothetical protein